MTNQPLLTVFELAADGGDRYALGRAVSTWRGGRGCDTLALGDCTPIGRAGLRSRATIRAEQDEILAAPRHLDGVIVLARIGGRAVGRLLREPLVVQVLLATRTHDRSILAALHEALDDGTTDATWALVGA